MWRLRQIPNRLLETPPPPNHTSYNTLQVWQNPISTLITGVRAPHFLRNLPMCRHLNLIWVWENLPLTPPTLFFNHCACVMHVCVCMFACMCACSCVMIAGTCVLAEHKGVRGHLWVLFLTFYLLEAQLLFFTTVSAKLAGSWASAFHLMGLECTVTGTCTTTRALILAPGIWTLVLKLI